MPLDSQVKRQVMSEFGRSEKDTGSVDVQVALLTHRIRQLTEHMKRQSKDFHCQRGLLVVVGQRRRLLRYLQEQDAAHYRELIARLGIRR